MTLTQTQSMVRILNRYCFRSIWNETKAEYRVNVALTPVGVRYLRGSLRIGIDALTLPTENTQYVAFTAPAAAFNGGLQVTPGAWTTGEEILADTNTLLYLYTADGTLIPREHIHVYRSRISGRLFVAITKAVCGKIFTHSYGTVYLTPYRDSSAANPITCRSWWIDPTDEVDSAVGLTEYFAACKVTNLAGTTVLVNGEEVDETASSITFEAGDYIEIILDTNVIGVYTVNVSNGTTAYTSEMTSELREILHCPKSINPQNKLITHNTCTISIRRTSDKVGRYFHRTEDTAAGQLTHNDLSINTNVVDAFRTALDHESLEVRVRVRTHSSDNVLIGDLFYIALLYQDTDANILLHLRGDIDPTLTFWKAEELEQSFYIQLMFDTPNLEDEELLAEYVSGLGYHTVATILGANVSYANLEGEARYFNVLKAPALIGKTVRPLIYLRGDKLNRDQYTYVNLADRVQVRIDPAVDLDGDDAIAVVLIEHGDAQPYLFEPTAEVTYIDVPFTDGVVYRKLTVDPELAGHSGTTAFTYAVVPEQGGTLVKSTLEDGGCRFVAGPSLYDETLLVWNKEYSIATIYDLTDNIATTKGALVVPLTMSVINDEDLTVPVLGGTTTEAYFNGRKLIEGLDVVTVPVVDDDDNVGMVELVISALDMIDFEEGASNLLEVITHTGAVVSQETGYTYEGKVSFDTTVNVWSTGLSRAYVRGQMIQNPSLQGHWIDPLTESEVSGEPYQLLTVLPGSVATTLSEFDQSVNINRLSAIRNYFEGVLTVDKDFILIENGYTIHSPYLAQIVRDLIEGDLTVANDPDNALFLAQFDGYAYLKARDPTQTTPPVVLDRVYVDVLSTYVPDWSVGNPVLFTVINRLVALTLPNDPNALGSIN